VDGSHIEVRLHVRISEELLVCVGSSLVVKVSASFAHLVPLLDSVIQSLMVHADLLC